MNFRTPTVTLDCLRSLEPEVAANPGTRVVVLDNGSGDDSVERIREGIAAQGWGSWCDLVAESNNWGFAGGNNRALDHANRGGGAEYVLLLNSDTLVHPGCLAYCLSVMDKDATIGTMTCLLLNRDGSPQNVCRKFPTPLRCLACSFSLPWRLPKLFGWANCDDPNWDRMTTVRDVDWLAGAFMLLRGDWIAKHGLLDERFFFYSEDVEICHRIWKSGFRCHYDPRARITHLGGASSDPSRMSTGKLNIHSWRGRYLAQRICYGWWAYLLLRICDIVNVGARVLWGALTGKRRTEAHKTMAEELRVLIRNWSRWRDQPA